MANGGNIAVILHGPEDLRLETTSIPEPGENEVQLAIRSVGICGSDLKLYKYGKCGRFTLTKPMVAGHEASGVVSKLGEGVAHLKVGDRVAVEPGIPCRRCRVCKEGRYNLCDDIYFCSTPPDNGNLARYYVHAADFCFKLPDNVSLDEGALVEPLAVAVYSCQRAALKPGATILICGAGPVGLLIMKVARTMGATTVSLTDIDEHRLKTAQLHGADHVIKVETQDSKALSELVVNTMGCRPNVSFECSGTDMSLRTGMYATRSGGCVINIGRGSHLPSIPIMEAATREVDIKGIMRYANCYPAAIALLSSGQLEAKSLITHHFKLEDSIQAFKTAMDPAQRSIKVMINC